MSEVLSSRLNIRISDEDKALIELAAKLENLNISQFVLQSAKKIARETMLEHEKISLNKQESQRFLDLLKNPPKPNAALLSAMEKYSEYTD